MIVRSNRWPGAALGLLFAAGLALPAAAEQAPAVNQAGAPGVQARKPTHHHVTHKPRQSQQLALTRPATLPTPPAPPRVGPAPTPNDGVTAPVENPDPKTDLQPSVFSLHYPPQGDGYTTGSSPQAMDDRNAAKATGVQLTVPLK